MADKGCIINDERDSRPQDDLFSESEDDESFPTRQDVMEKYQETIDGHSKKIALHNFMCPQNRNGLLYTFLAATSTPDYADDDRRENVEKMFIIIVKQFLSRRTAAINRLTQARCKMLHIDSFDTFVRFAAGRTQSNPRKSPWRFKQLNMLAIGLWNQAYEPRRKRVFVNSCNLDPLSEALKDLALCKIDSDLLDCTWNVINWWLEPPDSTNIYKDTPKVPLSACWGDLQFMEARLRSSGHVLDAEKADMVKLWLSSCVNQTLEDVNQASEDVSKATEDVSKAPEDINQTRREEGWKNLYLKSH